MASSARLAELIDNLGVSQLKFSKEIGANNAAINRSISRGSEIKADTIALVTKRYPNVNLHWLVTGEGKMWKDDVRDEDKTRAELLMKVQNLEDELKKANYILGTKENMIAGRGRRIEQLETYVAELEYRIELMEKEQK